MLRIGGVEINALQMVMILFAIFDGAIDKRSLNAIGNHDGVALVVDARDLHAQANIRRQRPIESTKAVVRR